MDAGTLKALNDLFTHGGPYGVVLGLIGLGFYLKPWKWLTPTSTLEAVKTQLADAIAERDKNAIKADKAVELASINSAGFKEALDLLERSGLVRRSGSPR